MGPSAPVTGGAYARAPGPVHPPGDPDGRKGALARATAPPPRPPGWNPDARRASRGSECGGTIRGGPVAGTKGADADGTMLLGHRPIVLTGVSRSGKSILARRLAAATGRVLLRTDDLRRAYWDDPDPGMRLARRRACFAEHLRRHDGHVVLEGVDLMFADAVAPALAKRGVPGDNIRPDLRHALALRWAAGALLAALAFPDAPVDAKIGAIHRHRAAEPCWTARLSEGGLRYSVRRWRWVGSRLRHRARDAAVPFHGIGADHFDRDLRRAERAILDATARSASRP